MDAIKFGMQYWKKYLPRAILLQLISFMAILANLFLPLICELFIDYVINDTKELPDNIFRFLVNGNYGANQTFTLFYHIAAVFLTLLFFRIICIYIKNTFFERLGLNVETDLRVVTFEKFMELDSQTVSEFNTGELLTTLHTDTIMMKDLFCRAIPNLFDSSFVLLCTSIILARINIRLLIIPVILAPFFAVALMRFKRQAKENYQNIRASNSRMNLTVQENIEAVRLVRSFTNEELEKRKFDESNQNMKASYIKQIWLSSKFEVIFSSIKQIAYIGTIAVCAVLVMRGQLLVGFLVTCGSYVLTVMNHITQINNMLFQMQQQIVAGNKIKTFAECQTKIKDGTKDASVEKAPHLRFENVSVTLDGMQVLKDINLDIPAGKKLGVVGATGSGKSVLLKSLVRIHDVTEGRITLNGTDIREFTLDSLRDQLSYVFQDAFLFSNTIDSNIAFARPDVSEEQVEEAAEHAQASGFVKKLPEGYQTIVGEKGFGLSGGQKQRVSIARAMLKDAPVFVFDDSTSALDAETEKRLLADINTCYQDKTILIAAHKMSSVVGCDEIIYIKDGIIAERGNFEELMAFNGHFASIYNIQKAQQESAIDFDALSAEGR